MTVYIGFHHAPKDNREEFIRSCHRALKRGGSLIVRDHDVTDPTMVHFVALAHDVFNCGLELPGARTPRRSGTSCRCRQLEAILRTTGFVTHDRRLLQEGDPTRNTLMRFDKA